MGGFYDTEVYLKKAIKIGILEDESMSKNVSTNTK